MPYHTIQHTLPGGVDAMGVVGNEVGVEGAEDVAHVAAGVDLHAAAAPAEANKKRKKI